ncbi:hypothetical protein E3N88_02880 [Mikania micrantha]|uniref:Uncharacterized protein n=1 Tax=Mikania micrantha TaxID=192012 RepID=A0A5N6Q4Z5_9ASTR|nr:hypothetical protein E3N88_02880 [Mikania micrantha]
MHIEPIGILYDDEMWNNSLKSMHPLASSLPIYGCYQYWKKTSDHNINHVELEAEQATTATPLIEESLVPQHMPMKPSNIGEVHVRKTAGIWGLYLSNNLPGMVIKGQVI